MCCVAVTTTSSFLQPSPISRREKTSSPPASLREIIICLKGTRLWHIVYLLLRYRPILLPSEKPATIHSWPVDKHPWYLPMRFHLDNWRPILILMMIVVNNSLTVQPKFGMIPWRLVSHLPSKEGAPTVVILLLQKKMKLLMLYFSGADKKMDSEM